jgi:tryptophan synthase alpha chain
MNRIEEKFKQLKNRKRKAFVAFITAGYPDLKTTENLILELDRLAVDVVEIGVPFSDPMADGPVIQESSQSALEKGVHLEDILKLVRRLRKKVKIPICLMGYFNPIFCFGRERFIRQAKRSGVDGLIIPDLPPEEDKEFILLAHRNDLDVICFIAPTTTIKRIKFIDKLARGFIYYVSLTGVTGVRSKLPVDLKKNLRLVKKYTTKPVCVGFGVSQGVQVREVQKYSDGVIVGSAIIKKIKENIGKSDLVSKVGNFVKSLKGL